MPRFRRRSPKPNGHSPDEEANIAYLTRQRAREAEIKQLEAEVARLEAKASESEAEAAHLKLEAARDEQKTEVVYAVVRGIRSRADARAERAGQIRAAIDRRIGRHTIDTVLFGLLAAAWWFWFFDGVVRHLIAGVGK
jgi:hypothetical protein